MDWGMRSNDVTANGIADVDGLPRCPLNATRTLRMIENLIAAWSISSHKKWNQQNPQNKCNLIITSGHHICNPQQDVAITLKSMSRVSSLAVVVDVFL